MKEINIKKFLEKNGYKPYVKITQKNAYIATYNALLQSKVELIKKTPVDTGLMASSWEIQKKSPTEILLGNTAPYSFEVEYGTPPRKLDTEEWDSLRAWVARKLINLRPIDKQSKEADSITWAIAKNIEMHGREPTFIMNKEIEKTVKPNILRNFKKAEGKTNDEFIQSV